MYQQRTAAVRLALQRRRLLQPQLPRLRALVMQLALQVALLACLRPARLLDMARCPGPAEQHQQALRVPPLAMAPAHPMARVQAAGLQELFVHQVTRLHLLPPLLLLQRLLRMRLPLRTTASPACQSCLARLRPCMKALEQDLLLAAHCSGLLLAQLAAQP